MILREVWRILTEKVFPVPSTERLFNQYKDKDLGLDLPDADKIRRDNLKRYLKGFRRRPSILVVGEAPGYRGARFSGVPFTSESQLCNSDVPFKGCQSGAKRETYSEQTAKTFWRVMLPYYQKFLVWNCIPFHPHDEEQPLSNRRPEMGELREYSGILLEIFKLIDPEITVAIGTKAREALDYIGVPSIKKITVRHPSYGGAKEFEVKIKEVLAKA